MIYIEVPMHTMFSARWGGGEGTVLGGLVREAAEAGAADVE